MGDSTGRATAPPPPAREDYTPREIVAELDRYIIGQDMAKKSVAIALRNRYRRRLLDPELQEEVAPKNIILMGPTGVGKTEIARRLSRLVRAPFFKVEITKYTEVGYVGRDVESMVRDLTSIAVNMVKEEHTALVREKARLAAEDRILDRLLPKDAFDLASIREKGLAIGFDAQEERRREDNAEHHAAREAMRDELRRGLLDDREFEYESRAAGPVPVMSVFGGPGMEDMDMQLQQMLGDLVPRQPRTRKISVAEAKRIFQAEEVEKLIDMEKVAAEAVRRAEETGIIFIDEIDKIVGAGGKSGPDVSRHGVQRDLLPIVEGTTVNTKHGPVRTNHILFISAGAFSASKPSDLIPELQGRFPIRVELHSLSESDFGKILTQPKNSLTRQYVELLRTEGVELRFTDDAVAEIARTARRLNEENENIGARRLHTIMEKLLEDVLFEAPDLPEERRKITIDAERVAGRLWDTVKDRDAAKYLL
ncbi:MAG TPA: ATP-dependent protease ATPase subunit HslU [Spirochaetota bacterium]|nr:ATP-dependent protease ATPase subunit HslU [Spirochaetota bacterium]